MSIKHIAGWAAVAFVMWWLIESPSNAQHVVENVGHFLAVTAYGFSHFIASV